MGLTWTAITVANTIAFFIYGLPGGLDYIMLAFVKHNWMSRLRESLECSNQRMATVRDLRSARDDVRDFHINGLHAPGWAAALGSALCL